MAGSSGSGSLVSSRLSVGFGFWSQCQYFIASADIWSDRSRFGRYLARSVDFGLDLDEISPDLARSGGFHAALRRKIKNIAGSGGLQWFQEALCPKTFGSRRILLIYGRVRWLGFLGGNSPANSKGSSPVGGNPSETVGLINSGGGRSFSGGSSGMSESPGCLDTPTHNNLGEIAIYP